MTKNSCTPINPNKYSCYDLKKIHTSHLITKKAFLRLENPPLPHNFSNGPSLYSYCFSIPKAREPIRFLHLTTRWNRQKITFLKWVSFALLREMKDRLNWFVGLDFGTIFPPKNTLYSWHVIEQWDAALKWNLRLRLKKNAMYLRFKIIRTNIPVEISAKL